MESTLRHRDFRSGTQRTSGLCASQPSASITRPIPFPSFQTTYESFSSSSYGGILRGSDIESHQRARHSTFAGYFQAADEFDPGFDLEALLFGVQRPIRHDRTRTLSTAS